MYNFAIIDNSSIDIDNMKNRIDAYFLDKFEYHCDIFLDAADFSNEKHYDAIFLDIEMPNINGFELAKSINYTTKVIFMTRHDNLVTLTFDYKPFHFIQKNNFDSSSSHVLNQLEKSLYSQTIKVINKDSIAEIINTEIISHISIENGIVSIHTFGDEIYTTWTPLASLMTILDPALFVKINQSHIINMNFIQTADNKSLTLKNGTYFSIAYRERGSFKKTYQKFLLK